MASMRELLISYPIFSQVLWKSELLDKVGERLENVREMSDESGKDRETV